MSARDIERLGPESLATRKPPPYVALRDTHVVYGLGPRHDRFHPPFTPVPDYSLSELRYNFVD